MTVDTPVKPRLLALVFLLFPPVLVCAGTYWVSPNGMATWQKASSLTPLSGVEAASLKTANANLVAGDTVYLRGGTYSQSIEPSNSGMPNNPISYVAYGSETPLFTGNLDAIVIQGKSHIVVDRITANNVDRFFFIINGSHYNEIKNCTFDTGAPGSTYAAGYIGAWGDPGTNACTHNWIHHNTFTKAGAVVSGDDMGTHLRIGWDNGDESNYMTIEHNVFSYGGHDLIDIAGRFQVIRNNIFHNEDAYFPDTGGSSNSRTSSGYFGNRDILIQWYPSTDIAGDSLIENNRAGYAGTPPDDDGSMGIEISSPRNIVRFNDFFGNGGTGLYFKSGYNAHNNRVYNNTIYHNGRGDIKIWGDQWKAGVHVACYCRGNIFTNNIVYDNLTADYKYNGGCELYTALHVNNNFYNNYELDPLFVNPSMSDKTSQVSPDLRLQSASGAIDAGKPLTVAVGSGSNSTSLVVADARFFQDGTWGSSLSTVYPDRIAIGTVSNVRKIVSINYVGNIIALESSATWTDGAPIWLYSDSSDRVVLHGFAPDMGAHSYEGTPAMKPAAPSGLRILGQN